MSQANYMEGLYHIIFYSQVIISHRYGWYCQCFKAPYSFHFQGEVTAQSSLLATVVPIQKFLDLICRITANGKWGRRNKPLKGGSLSEWDIWNGGKERVEENTENGKKEKERGGGEELVGICSSEISLERTMFLTLQACIILATSTLVFPLTDAPLTPTNSSPLCNVPSRAAGVLSNTCTRKAVQIKYHDK